MLLKVVLTIMEYVPDNMISVIEQLKEEPILTRYYDVDYIIEQMKEDLRKHGVMNFKPNPHVRTLDTTINETAQTTGY